MIVDIDELALNMMTGRRRRKCGDGRSVFVSTTNAMLACSIQRNDVDDDCPRRPTC
jgi:hypothetical protein